MVGASGQVAIVQRERARGRGERAKLEPTCGSVSIRPTWNVQPIRESVVLITPMHMNDNLVLVVRMSPRGPVDRGGRTLIRRLIEGASHRMPQDGPTADGQVRETPIEMLVQMRGVQARGARTIANNLQVVPSNARSFLFAQGAEQVHDELATACLSKLRIGRQRLSEKCHGYAPGRPLRLSSPKGGTGTAVPTAVQTSRAAVKRGQRRMDSGV